MRNLARTFALLYASIVGIVALWAWYTDVRLLHSQREHLLPGVMLAFVSLPMSKTLEPLYDRWQAFFLLPFVQLAWLTVCGAFQAAVLYMLSTLIPRLRNQA
jgi:hypothetical protein